MIYDGRDIRDILPLMLSLLLRTTIERKGGNTFYSISVSVGYRDGYDQNKIGKEPRIIWASLIGENEGENERT